MLACSQRHCVCRSNGDYTQQAVHPQMISVWFADATPSLAPKRKSVPYQSQIVLQRTVPEGPMRIKTLTLKNFRSHQETVLEFDRFNFVRGPNGCGKSSIQMALEYLFTGRCQMTDAAGRGAEALIRSGAKELQVSATLENGETISRRRTARSHIVELDGKRVPVDAAEAFLEKRFGSTDVLSAELNAGRFIEMSEAEQKRLLAQVVDAGKVDIPAEIGDALRAIDEELPRIASVGDVEAAYRRFYDLCVEA